MWKRIRKKVGLKSKTQVESSSASLKSGHEEKPHLRIQDKIDYKIKHHNHGIIWRLEQIFSRHVTSNQEKYNLLQFCQRILGPGLSREERIGESFTHMIISSIPESCSEFECHKYFSTRITEILIADGLDVVKTNNAGDPPIIAAYKSGKYAVVNGFFNKRSPINIVDRYGTTLLILACKANDLSTIKQILYSYGKQLSIDVEDLSQNCALSYATLNDNYAICKLLLEAGANPNASYTPPLYQAVRNDCCTDIIELLIDHGASVNAWIDFTGLNTLRTAANKNRTDVVRLLINAGAHFPSTWHTNRAFSSALKWDNIQIVLLFLEKSVEITSKTNKGTNIIHEICTFGSNECLKYLINNTKIDLNELDRHGKSAFFKAAENGHVKCMELLFEANTKCFQSDSKGLSPLEVAIFNDHNICVEFILDHLVCSQSVLMNISNLLRTDYDQAEFCNTTAIKTLFDFTMTCDSVSSLLIICILRIKDILNQRSESKVNVLPLPSIIKDLLR